VAFPRPHGLPLFVDGSCWARSHWATAQSASTSFLCFGLRISTRLMLVQTSIIRLMLSICHCCSSLSAIPTVHCNEKSFCFSLFVRIEQNNDENELGRARPHKRTARPWEWIMTTQSINFFH
jgi:hypothetical protein